MPADRLIIHPPTETLGQVREWIVQNTPQHCVVQVDDDFTGVRPRIGLRRKKLIDPVAITSILVSGYQICNDLGLSAFYYAPNPNPSAFSPMEPIKLTAPMCGVFGILGKRLHFDKSLIHGEDCDFLMKVLLRDRVAYCDDRVCFDTGGMMHIPGGLQAMRTDAIMKNDVAKLKDRWGPHLLIQKKSHNYGKRVESDTIHIVVPRKRQAGL